MIYILSAKNYNIQTKNKRLCAAPPNYSPRLTPVKRNLAWAASMLTYQLRQHNIIQTICRQERIQMDALLEFIELSGAELTRIVTLAVILLLLLVVGRVALKLTATLFRLGCFVILLIVGAVYIISILAT